MGKKGKARWRGRRKVVKSKEIRRARSAVEDNLTSGKKRNSRRRKPRGQKLSAL